MKRTTAVAFLAATLLVAACGSDEDDTTDTTATAATAAPTTAAATDTTTAATTAAGDACADVTTLEEGVLTIATGNPAFEPWVVGDAPESGEGFEAAVAYAVAEEMGFPSEKVTWVRTSFDEAIAPGPKNFDFNLQQISISPERTAVLSMSNSYYSTNQAIVALEGSAAEGAVSTADLKDVKFGAQVGTTSLQYITDVIQPDEEAFAYNDNADAKQALESNQIDAIVVDLPTAFFISAVEIEGSKVVGQFPPSADFPGDEFGLVFEKDNPLVDCANQAIGALQADDRLDAIESQWLGDYTGAPLISAPG